MIGWFKKLFGRKPMPIPAYHTITIPPEGVKWPSQETPYQTAAIDALSQRRALIVDIDRERAKTTADLPPPAAQEMEDFRARRRPVRVSPHLATAYGRQPPPVRRLDEPSSTVDLMLVHALLSSPPAPAPESTVSTTQESCRAPSYSSGGGGDFGGGGASSSWDSSSSISDSGASSSSSD